MDEILFRTPEKSGTRRRGRDLKRSSHEEIVHTLSPVEQEIKESKIK